MTMRWQPHRPALEALLRPVGVQGRTLNKEGSTMSTIWSHGMRSLP